jgi:UDP-N-acetylmuramyl tripeptide synthase
MYQLVEVREKKRVVLCPGDFFNLKITARTLKELHPDAEYVIVSNSTGTRGDVYSTLLDMYFTERYEVQKFENDRWVLVTGTSTKESATTCAYMQLAFSAGAKELCTVRVIDTHTMKIVMYSSPQSINLLFFAVTNIGSTK